MDPVRPVRVAMVGGGPGAFIGAIHRHCLRLDGLFDLAAGCFSGDYEKTLEIGRTLGISEERLYGSYHELLETEAHRRIPDRIEAIIIVTPNHLHYEPARIALEHGFHVICDKPLATSLDEARDLRQVSEATGSIFCVTYNYSGAPLVREARERVAAGDIGEVRKVFVEYLQGWLSTAIEREGHKQASWRTDPQRSGPVGALGDIGTHAFHLLEFVSGLKVTELYAQLAPVVEGRALDDDATLLLRLSGGATGVLTASQVCTGRENGLALRLYGTRGAIEWRQEQPNDLWVTTEEHGLQLIRTNAPNTGSAAQALTRLPAGHPEGYLEAFANLYRAFYRELRGEPQPFETPFPTLGDGERGLRLIRAALESVRHNRWVDFESGQPVGA